MNQASFKLLGQYAHKKQARLFNLAYASPQKRQVDKTHAQTVHNELVGEWPAEPNIMRAVARQGSDPHHRGKALLPG